MNRYTFYRNISCSDIVEDLTIAHYTYAILWRYTGVSVLTICLNMDLLGRTLELKTSDSNGTGISAIRDLRQIEIDKYSTLRNLANKSPRNRFNLFSSNIPVY